VEVKPYQPWHAEGLMLPGLAGEPVVMNEVLAPILARGEAASLFLEGELAGVAGLALCWPGVAEAWFGPTVVTRRASLGVIKALDLALRKTAGRLSLHRVGASILKSNRTAARFAEVLRFEREGTMKQFGPQRQDFLRYARLF